MTHHEQYAYNATIVTTQTTRHSDSAERHSMSQPDYDPLYLKGIEHFNACDFYESHEAWEELWMEEQGPSRRFYQGLIQAAVALHHFGNGNIRGARKLNESFRKYLEPYAPHHLGLDVTKFLADMDRCFQAAMQASEEFPDVEIDPELIPEIHLNPTTNGGQT
jgi:predicted metal-dependent hydrolase